MHAYLYPCPHVFLTRVRRAVWWRRHGGPTTLATPVGGYRCAAPSCAIPVADCRGLLLAVSCCWATELQRLGEKGGQYHGRHLDAVPCCGGGGGMIA